MEWEEMMNEDLKDVVKTLRDNGDRLTGLDGGVALFTLRECSPTLFVSGGKVNYGMGQVCDLEIHIYIWEDYKFVVQESITTVEDMGSSPDLYATVDLYNNGDPR